MESGQNKLALKKIILTLIGILFVGAFFAFYYFYQQKQVVLNKVEKEVDEVQKIKDENAQAINQAGSAAVRPVRAIDKTDHFLGSLEAPVQLIIYEDFECPFCAKYYDTINEMKKNYGEKIVIAFRHYPLSGHSLAVPAAIASECAAEQGKFWEMYDKLFSLNKAGNLNPEEFKKAAADLKLDPVKFNKCFDTEKYKDMIQEQMVEARNFGVTGVPASFLNSQPLPGAVPFEDYTSSDGRAMKGMRGLIEKILGESN